MTTIHTIIRRDRANDAGWGGVLLAMRSQYPIQQICNLENYSSDFEIIVAIITLKYKRIVVCVVYIPPSSDDEKFTRNFLLLENVVTTYSKLDVLIIIRRL